MNDATATLIQKFAALPHAAKIEFFTRFIHDQTVGTRMIYLLRPTDSDRVRAKNELIHQTSNYIFQLLGINRYLDYNDFIEELIKRLDAMGENGRVTLEKTLAELKISN